MVQQTVAIPMVVPPRDLTAEYLAFHTYPRATLLGCSFNGESWRFGSTHRREKMPTARLVAMLPTRTLSSTARKQRQVIV
jgi:hypothetical protein